MTSAKPKSTRILATQEVAPDNFEHALTDLEKIVAQMESGQMSLEASLAAYQRGDALLQYCQKSLAEVEQQVQILNARNQLNSFQPNQE